MLRDTLRALGRRVGERSRDRAARRARAAAAEHEVGQAARAGLRGPADLRDVGRGGQIDRSGAS